MTEIKKDNVPQDNLKNKGKSLDKLSTCPRLLANNLASLNCSYHVIRPLQSETSFKRLAHLQPVKGLSALSVNWIFLIGVNCIVCVLE